MKYSKFLSFTLLALMLLAACAPQGQITATQTSPAGQPTLPALTQPPAEVPTEIPPTPYETGIAPPAAVLAAQQALAERLNISTGDIQIREIEQVQWSDSCLGAGRPDESCLQVITDGFRAVFAVDGQLYEYHTNMDGSQIRAVEGPVVEGPGEVSMPAAVLAAQQTLAGQVGASPAAIRLFSAEQVEWPDACLGVASEGEMCAEGITPGWRVVFEYEDTRYAFHTNADGSLVVEAPLALPQVEGTVLAWELSEDGACSRLEIGPEGALYGPCDGALEQTEFSVEQAGQLAQLLSEYAPFTAETPAGTLDFQGQGSRQAEDAVQRSVAEWARMVYLAAESGQGDAERGLVMTWHREGGIAGFCDNLSIYASGWAYASSCRGGQSQPLGSYRLNADQLAQLYAWVDRLDYFEYQQQDPPGAADAMSIVLVFSGAGAQQPTQAEQEEIVLFGQLVYTMAVR